MIVFEHVSKKYPGAVAPAVEDFSFQIPRGQTTVFVGSSGSGKTTLVRMINRMVTPTSGRVLIDGADSAEEDPVRLRRRIGYVMQDSGLMPHRTVLDNICTVPRLNKVPKAQCRERAFELMDDLGLDRALAKRYPRELSGGQAQRVGIARALADNPAIMIMDEPFSAIDPLVRRDLQNQVLDLKRRLNKTIVMVTHDIEEAFLLGDQIVLLGQRGRIEQAGTAEELITQPANDFVADFVGVQDRVVSVQRRDGRDVIVDRHGRVTAFVQGDA